MTVEAYELTYTIGGTDRGTFIQHSPQPRMESNLSSQLDTFEVRWYDPAQVAEPTVWQDFVVTNGATTVFGGKITQITKLTLPSTDDDVAYDIVAQDWGIVVEKTSVNEQFLAKTDGEIIQDLFAKYLPNFDATTYVVDAGLTYTNKTFNRKYLGDVLRDICEDTGYDWYVDEDKNLHYFPETTNTAPFDLSDTPDGSTTFGFAKGSLTIDTDASDIRNRVYVYGGDEEQEDPLLEKFAGDGETAYFKLAYSASSASVWVNGSVNAVGTVGQQTFDEGYTALIDPPRRLLTFSTATPPPVGTAETRNISALYYYNLPVVVRARSFTSYQTYGEWFDYTIIDNSISDSAIAQVKAESVLLEHAYARVSGQVNLWKPGLRAGQRVKITSSKHGVDTHYLIRRVSMTAMSLWNWEFQIDFGVYSPDLVEMLMKIKRDAYQEDAIDPLEEAELYDYLDSSGTVTLTGTVTLGTSVGPYLWGVARWGFATWT